MIAMTLAVTGCGGGGARDAQPDFGPSNIADKTYPRGLEIDSEQLPAATGGDGKLTYTIAPELPEGLSFDPATRLLSGTPMAAQPATLYTYAAIDSDSADPDSASLTFTITVEAVASVAILAETQEVDEGAPVPEEDPAVIAAGMGGAVRYNVVFLNDEHRIPTTCGGFARDTEPGTQDPLLAQQWPLNNTGQMSFATRGGTAGEDLNMGQTLASGPTGVGCGKGRKTTLSA